MDMKIRILTLSEAKRNIGPPQSLKTLALAQGARRAHNSGLPMAMSEAKPLSNSLAVLGFLGLLEMETLDLNES